MLRCSRKSTCTRNNAADEAFWAEKNDTYWIDSVYLFFLFSSSPTRGKPCDCTSSPAKGISDEVQGALPRTFCDRDSCFGGGDGGTKWRKMNVNIYTVLTFWDNDHTVPRETIPLARKQTVQRSEATSPACTSCDRYCSTANLSRETWLIAMASCKLNRNKKRNLNCRTIQLAKNKIHTATQPMNWTCKGGPGQGFLSSLSQNTNLSKTVPQEASTLVSINSSPRVGPILTRAIFFPDASASSRNR